MKRPKPLLPACDYFVDEAGDATLFGRRGRVLVGSEGCSRFFIVGYAAIDDPQSVAAQLNQLRHTFLNDPYFRRVPSLQPQENKLAIAFHAKDDLPEIRWQVMQFIRATPGIRFSAVVRDKSAMVRKVLTQNLRIPQYRYHPNMVYDELVRRLFKTDLHRAESYRICFARRGDKDRTAALSAAIRAAQQNFRTAHPNVHEAPIQIADTRYQDEGCLQVVDYLLWALQRLFERGEDRYVEYLWGAFRRVVDIDDHQRSYKGVYYTQDKPLTRAAIAHRIGNNVVPEDIG